MTGADYAAFLSYNSADREAARRLQRALESYAIPRALRGRTTAFGVIGERLGRVCRDRTDFKSGESLNAALKDALDKSSALVVLCSPASAASKWVNAEIEHFRKSHGAARIFPIVVATDASGAIVNSFPPALQRADGDEPIAADLQPSGDGWNDGVLKILASILDVDYDALRQRALVAARRRARIAYAIAGGMGVLAVAAIGAGAVALKQRNRALDNFEDAIIIAAKSASRFNDLSEQTEVPRALIQRYLDETDKDIKNLTSMEAMRRHPRVKLVAAEFQLLLSDRYADVGRSKDQLRSSLAAETLLQAIKKDAADAAGRFVDSVLFGESNMAFYAGDLEGKVADSLGKAWLNNGVLDRARAEFGRCRKARIAFMATWELEPEEVAELESGALSCAANEANVLAMLNQPSAAIALLEPLVASTQDAASRGYARLVLAQLYADNNRLGPAIGTLTDEIRARVDAAEERQERIDLAKLFETRAKALSMTGRISDASDDLARAETLLSVFLADDANDRRVLLLNAELLTTSGEAFALEGARDKAELKFAEAAAIFDRLLSFDAGRRDWRLARARLLIGRADNAFRRFEADPNKKGSLSLAMSAARAAIADVETVQSAGDEVAARLRLVAEVSLARASRLAGDEVGARRTLAAAAAGLTDAKGSAHALQLALIDDERGDLAEAAGAHAEATKAYDAAIARFDDYLARETAAGLVRRDLLWTLLSSANAARAGGDIADARRRLAKACALKKDTALAEYSLFARDARTLDSTAREAGVEC